MTQISSFEDLEREIIGQAHILAMQGFDARFILLGTEPYKYVVHFANKHALYHTAYTPPSVPREKQNATLFGLVLIYDPTQKDAIRVLSTPEDEFLYLQTFRKP